MIRFWLWWALKFWFTVATAWSGLVCAVVARFFWWRHYKEARR